LLTFNKMTMRDGAAQSKSHKVIRVTTSNMNGRRRRPYRQIAHAAATIEARRHILRTFIGMLADQLPGQITLDEVAERTCSTRQTLIRHFGGKDSLMQVEGEQPLRRCSRTTSCSTGLRVEAHITARLEALLSMAGVFPPRSRYEICASSRACPGHRHPHVPRQVDRRSRAMTGNCRSVRPNQAAAGYSPPIRCPGSTD
jgi:hypothetical protein